MSYNKFRRDKIPFTLYRLIRTPTCDCPGREQHVGVPAKQGGLNDYAKKECQKIVSQSYLILPN